MDPLSDVLSLLRPSDYAFRGLEAGGSWALHYPADGSLKCFAVTMGSCWLWGEAPVGQRRLQQGDVVMVRGCIAVRGGTVVEDASFRAFAADETAVIILLE